MFSRPEIIILVSKWFPFQSSFQHLPPPQKKLSWKQTTSERCRFSILLQRVSVHAAEHPHHRICPQECKALFSMSAACHCISNVIWDVYLIPLTFDCSCRGAGWKKKWEKILRCSATASVATFPLMRFVDDNDYGSDSDDDVSALKQPAEIPGVVVLMKRARGDGESQWAAGCEKKQKKASRQDESMNKRRQNWEILAQNMKDVSLHAVLSKQRVLSFQLHPCTISPLVRLLQALCWLW